MKQINPAWLFIALVIIYLNFTSGIRFIPERSVITYVNEKYLYNNCSTYITRYGRKSPYYLNTDFTIKHSWGNNVTVHLNYFEHQNNQYKRSFVELHMKLCDLFHTDNYFGVIISTVMKNYGVSCPVPKGIYQFKNITIASQSIVYNILQFQKGKAEATFNQLPTNDVIGTMYFTFTIQQT